MKKELTQLETALNELHNSNDVSDAAYSTLKFAIHQVKNLTMHNVSNNEERVAVCGCRKGKFVFNEVTQQLICGCGRRIKITN